MNNAIFNEAFKKLDLLEEEDFNLSRAGSIEDAGDFLDDEINDDVDVIDIIDVDAEDEEELQDNYIGDVILECDVCHSMIYKKPEEVQIDEETQTVNTQEECPYCMSMDGFKVIGQVAPFRENEFDITVDGEDIDQDGDIDEIEEVEIEESIKPGSKRKLKEACKKGKCKNEACLDEEVIEDDEEEIIEEGFNDVSITTDDSHMEMSSDENGKVTVSTEPITSDFYADYEGDEMIEPLQDDTIEEIADNQDVDMEDEFDEEEYVDDLGDEEDMDIDVDEFDEEGFNDLGESYLKRVYENVNSFRTTNVRANNNTLKVEGVINFKSGSKKKTSFLFEAKDISKTGKIRFIGENQEITRGKKSFTVTGKMKGNKFMCESLNYNYQAKNNRGKSTKLYGTVKVK